ncbi:MAG: threonylcarbamoyl-AMP synthase [Actinobacteria bacterium]|nr:threonylcarbamoyl-AMP synthase [Actinomycetota bacterium]
MAESDAHVRDAVAVLRRGGLVAFPTETVYGLGADASSAAAVRRLYAVKGRPAHHPVIVHLGGADALDEWAAAVPPSARLLAEAFWPGPLTLVLRRSARVPDAVTGGRDTVGLRVPDQPLALALLRAFGGGVAAPSANRFGRVSPTTAADVRADLGADVDLVLDGGPCRIGVESTIVDCTGEEPVIARLGGVPREDVERCLGRAVEVRDRGAVAAPGTLASHYAPRARVHVVDAAGVPDTAAGLLGVGRAVGLLALDAPGGLPAGVRVLAAPADVGEYARVLYTRLREADALGLDDLLVIPPPPTGLGAAVADRLGRAAAAGTEER